jgi:AraC-like DNA-binding protein
MTTRANPLTEGVNAQAIDSRQRWTMSGTDVRAFADALTRLGYDTGALLAAADVDPRQLGDPDTRISCEALGVMVMHAQQTRFTPNLGVEIARVTPIGSYALLDYLVLTADTVGAGAHQLARYLRLVGNPVVVVIEDDDRERVIVRMPSGPAPFSLEYSAALMALHFRTETDGRFAAARVDFEHTPDDAAAMARVLACPVHGGSSWTGLTIARDAWQLPLRRRDPVLRHVLEAHADDVIARLPARVGLAHDVQRALAARVPNGDTRIGALARELAMSGRTLQRRLADEGVSYQQLLDEARKEAAGRYLSEPTLAIAEVAYLVGYSEPAPFHRAFKRWYGVTPELYRQRSRRAAAKSA